MHVVVVLTSMFPGARFESMSSAALTTHIAKFLWLTTNLVKITFPICSLTKSYNISNINEGYC
ncbi:MAG: hypothetical protein C4322_22285 [Mastigocladus sp. ERB_26_1]